MTAFAANGDPLSMWEAEVTKLALVADELSPAVRRAVSSVLEAVLAEASLGVSEMAMTEELLDLLHLERTRRHDMSLGASRIFGLTIRARELAVA